MSKSRTQKEHDFEAVFNKHGIEVNVRTFDRRVSKKNGTILIGPWVRMRKYNPYGSGDVRIAFAHYEGYIVRVDLTRNNHKDIVTPDQLYCELIAEEKEARIKELNQEYKLGFITYEELQAELEQLGTL